MTILDRLLEERGYLLADGATGTNLFSMGLETGDAPEPWNIDHPDRIRALHQGFIDAGSDIILTNTFGGNFHRLKLHGAEGRVAEFNTAAGRIAREMADNADRELVVAGSIGPTGELFVPLGPLTVDAASEVFAEQAQALAAGGVDILWVETMSSTEEVQAALAGAATTGLPTVCTLSFDTNGSTMMGLSPPDFAALCRSIPTRPHAYGANCGLGPAETIAGVLNLATGMQSGEVIVAKGNCGVPEYVDGVIRYAGEPALMARYAELAYDSGARIIGGCCGTTFEHIAAMREALDNHTGGERPPYDTVTKDLGKISAGARALLEGKLHADTIAVGADRAGRRRRRRAS